MLFTFMLGLFACVGLSQAPLPPDQVLTQLKQEGTRFMTFSPFSTASQLRNQDFADICDDCIALNFDPTANLRLLNEQADFLNLNLPDADGGTLELELYHVDPFKEANFVVKTMSGLQIPASELKGRHYRGQVKGVDGSLAAVSVYENQIMVLLSTPERGNWVAGAIEGDPKTYLFYEDSALADHHAFDCATADSYEPYRPEELAPQAGLRSADACVQIYLEIDHDVYLDKGGLNETAEFILGIFNEVAVLYANENINIELSEVAIWDQPSPYSATNSYDMLLQFQRTRTSFNGDLGQLISYQASGGIAVVDGLCRTRTEFKLSFSSINRNYRSVPTFSYTVMVVAHELGHLFGSQHTHACVWNGNGTALDGCAGFVEGNCSLPTLPSDGGTIMSYCHITSVGINLLKGFGPQPAQLMRNRVASSNCLQVCSTPDDNGGNGGDNSNPNECIDVSLNLTLDLFGSETSWELRNEQGGLVASGSGYDNKKEGQVISQDFCLAAGCYSLRVSDSDGDGMCCQYGNGGFEIVDAGGQVLASGGNFDFQTTEEFCVAPSDDEGEEEEEEEEEEGSCLNVNFNDFAVTRFGGTQDKGGASIIEAGNGVKIANNAWKGVSLQYEVTENTMLRFEFQSTRRPEIGGIGLDENSTISSARTFNLYGSQNWGIRDFKNYNGNGEWKVYDIPVGQFYTGAMNYLFFAADHDRSPANGNASFRNIYLYEGAPCSGMPQVLPPTTASLVEDQGVKLYPNPSNDHVFFDLNLKEKSSSDGRIDIYNLYGQKVKAVIVEEAGTLKINTSDLPNGTYMYQLKGFESEYTGKFSVHR
ncbi:MAG: zinc-dependent metalloprotease [Bacteroidota bacterium]